MVACRENGKESAKRLIKHFSSECEEDWKKESCLVNELGETEHPNILTYCWHCKGMCSAACFKNVLEKLIHVWSCVFAVVTWENSENIRVPGQGTEPMTFRLCQTTHFALGGSLGREAVKLQSFS